MSYLPRPQDYFNLYDIKIKKLRDDYIEVYEYSDHIANLKEDVQNPFGFKARSNYDKADEGEIADKSMQRSFSILMDLAICNSRDFKSFITLTFADNVTDLDYANHEFKKFNSKVKRVYPEYKYLAVPEFQKRGAVHYHLMTNLSIVEHADILELQVGKKNMYDVKYWNHGFSSVFDLKLADDKFSVSLYLSKYFWKDIDNRLFGRRKILYSQNLHRPSIDKIDSTEIDKLNNYLKEMDLKGRKLIVPRSHYAPELIIKNTYIGKEKENNLNDT